MNLLNVYDAAITPAVTMGGDMAVKQAAALVPQLHLNRLVVVRRNGLIGLLAMNDIPAG